MPTTYEVKDDLMLFLEGRKISQFNEVRLTRVLDGIDQFAFILPFEPNAEYRSLFRPLVFQEVKIDVGGQTLLTGTLTKIEPHLEPKEQTVFLQGYSRPGVLTDCTASASAFPLEFNKQTLGSIARTLLEPFAISVQQSQVTFPIFQRVALRADEIIFDFLTRLARQRNLILGNTETGDLRIFQPSVNEAPVARLEEGQPPLLSVSPSFNTRQYYSSISGIQPLAPGKDGKKITLRNPHLSSSLRPFSFYAVDTKSIDLETAVKSKLGRMIANAINYRLKVPTWRSADGKIWDAGTFIQLEAPHAFVYQQTKFVIRSVNLQRTRNSEVSVLDCVLPGAFSGEIPERLPWDL